MPQARSTRTSLPAPPEIVSAALTVVVDIAYLFIVRSQDEGFTARHVFVAVHLLVIAGVIILGWRAQGAYLRAGLLAAGVNSLILVGFLGLFSVGLPLLIAGLVAMPALARALATVPKPAGPALVGLATLVAAGVMIGGLLATS
jgi:hypothetical protein